MPPIIDKEKCIRCQRCASICCMDVFGPITKGEVPKVRFPKECWHCRACVIECAQGAISMRYPLPLTILYREAVPLSEGEKND
ncbi:ferredoxin family protein [Peptococcus simiae]|uniref:Ferredoxin family protein n=1 Tax=Peptococcus simiae TaxID=1643805 RepID=A0ABW9GZR1_9FIRM